MKSLRIISFLSIFVVSMSNYGLTAQNSISISVGTEKGQVDKKVFGNNLVGHEWWDDFRSSGDYGYGVWDPKWDGPIKSVIDLMKDAKITGCRFPGGMFANHYDWKQAIEKDRKEHLFGINEFLKVCEQLDAEPIFTVAYFTGDENDAADLVEYLNTPVGTNPNGGTEWAKKRSENGHSTPFNLKYFEIGNEVYSNRYKHTSIEYANRYLKYYEAMKKVDSSIKIGFVLYDSGWNNWNKQVINVVGEKVDFGILHIYPTPVWGEKLSTMPAKEIFETSLAQPELIYEKTIQGTLTLIETNAGKKVPIAVTEFNGGFVQEKPVPYRHCLGTALINAEMLRVFMKPENNILMANYWQFCNSYWGMVANGFHGDPKKLNNPYYKRPNYYVFEMYAKHFGDILIEADVKCDSYDISKYSPKYKEKIPYLSANVSKDKKGKKVYLMVINKNMDEAMTATIDLKDFAPARKSNAWVLNGPSVDATNEKKHDNVKVTHHEFEIKNNTFEFIFEPHSLTAIEIEGKVANAEFSEKVQ